MVQEKKKKKKEKKNNLRSLSVNEFSNPEV
jgi:hypothetical protein